MGWNKKLLNNDRVREPENKETLFTPPPKSASKNNVSQLQISGNLKNQYQFYKTREFRCLAGEPKHFPFAIVFVLIIKITLTCERGFPNGNGS